MKEVRASVLLPPAWTRTRRGSEVGMIVVVVVVVDGAGLLVPAFLTYSGELKHDEQPDMDSLRP